MRKAVCGCFMFGWVKKVVFNELISGNIDVINPYPWTVEVYIDGATNLILSVMIKRCSNNKIWQPVEKDQRGNVS